VLWLQIALTYGATQDETPRRLRQSKHEGFVVDSVPKKLLHAFAFGPSAHAIAAPSRSSAGHTCRRAGADAFRAAGHPAYGPGHCVLLLVQTRGETWTSHVDAGLCAEQSSQAPPTSPHSASANPGWQFPAASQQPLQVEEHGAPPSGRKHDPRQVPPSFVQSVQRSPSVPHCVSEMSDWQLPAASQQPVLQVIGPHPGPAPAAEMHC